jgi:trans-2,3-dihydro-3-hydroxyanthranilate isomerase
MNTQFYTVDVFAEQKYAGNQLAVFRNAGHLSADEMQTLAREMNYSETTFILSESPRDGGYDVRIFTIDTELPFAGHPTLGTAFVIRNELLGGSADQVTLNLPIGLVPVSFAPDGVVWMQPEAPTFGETYDAQMAAEVISLTADDVDTRFPVQKMSVGVQFLFVPLKSRDAVRRAAPNAERFRALDDEHGLWKVFLFCPEPYSNDNHLNARMFWGQTIIGEDPATGSANVCFAGYLARHRYFGSSTVDVRVEQGYQINRPSLLYLRGSDDSGALKVSVGGRVFMVSQGTLV